MVLYQIKNVIESSLIEDGSSTSDVCPSVTDESDFEESSFSGAYSRGLATPALSNIAVDRVNKRRALLNEIAETVFLSSVPVS